MNLPLHHDAIIAQRDRQVLVFGNQAEAEAAKDFLATCDCQWNGKLPLHHRAMFAGRNVALVTWLDGLSLERANEIAEMLVQDVASLRIVPTNALQPFQAWIKEHLPAELKALVLASPLVPLDKARDGGQQLAAKLVPQLGALQFALGKVVELLTEYAEGK